MSMVKYLTMKIGLPMLNGTLPPEQQFWMCKIRLRTSQNFTKTKFCKKVGLWYSKPCPFSSQDMMQFPMHWDHVTPALPCDFLPQSMAAEEQDSFKFFVVEEIAEGPQRPLFSIRVRVQIRVVARGTEGHTRAVKVVCPIWPNQQNSSVLS